MSTTAPYALERRDKPIPAHDYFTAVNRTVGSTQWNAWQSEVAGVWMPGRPVVTVADNAAWERGIETGSASNNVNARQAAAH